MRVRYKICDLQIANSTNIFVFFIFCFYICIVLLFVNIENLYTKKEKYERRN